MLHTRIDTLFCGCSLAILTQDPLFVVRLRRVVCRPVLLGALLLFVLAVSPFLQTRLKGYYSASIEPTLLGVSISLLIFYCIHFPESPVGTLLNSAPLRHLGVISYSIYLWQQIFAGPSPLVRTQHSGVTILLILLLGEASYVGIEGPPLRLRRWLDKRRPELAP
jgi:peptidoglycan/LPS O-acetylase OafA/YrhL